MGNDQNTQANVLVTGASGFMGTEICQRLEKERFRVIRLDRQARDKKSIQVDLLTQNIRESLVQLLIDCVVHCAAVIPGSFLGNAAEEAAKKNLSIDRNIIEFCTARGVHLVFMSGSSVYGLDFDSIRTEDSEPDPIGPYVHAKMITEQRAVEQLGQDRVTVLRVSAPYGPGQKSMTVLQTFMCRALANEDLCVFGTGNRTQDFTWAGDVAQAVICSIRRGQGGIFNISGGSPVSMMELAQMVVKAIPGCISAVRAAGVPDPQENFRARFDISKARRELGWYPRMPLEKGIRRCVRYLRERG